MGRQSTVEPDAAQESRLTEPGLIDHVPQLLDSSHPSAPTPSTSTPLPPRNFNLNFPTLNTDGSTPDISTQQLALRTYPPTPPAALTSLGAKAKMEKKDFVSESEGAFSDSQYDMIDDLSEMSNDDNDTASIASNPEDGQLTPEDAGSEADPGESTSIVENAGIATPPSTAHFVVGTPEQASFRPLSTPKTSQQAEQIKAENELIDSYMSDDLETPRQSTMAAASDGTHSSPRAKGFARSAMGQDANHILFVSDSLINQKDMDKICTRVASCLGPFQISDAAAHKVVRLPVTPSGISPQSATVVCGENTVSATVQHCIGATVRSSTSYQLRILDLDREHTSFFTIGEDAKVDLPKPDIAVFYLGETSASQEWFKTAYKAAKGLKIPMLVLRHSSLSMDSISHQTLRSLLRNGQGHLQTSIEIDAFFAMSRRELLTFFDKFVGGGSSTVQSSSGQTRPTSKLLANVNWLRYTGLTIAFVQALLFIFLCLTPPPSPAVALSARRESLLAALLRTTNSSHVIRSFNIEHLLPEPDVSCASTDFLGRATTRRGCTYKTVHYQGVPPNHIVISLPGVPRLPQVTFTQVSRHGENEINYNQTKLIEGVYDITIDPDEAHGYITVNMITQKPGLNIRASHNFGSLMLLRKTYDKAGTEVAKAVSKDVAIMRSAAKTIKDRISTELEAGLWATKNVTTQVALYVAHDLQLLGNTAFSILGKAAEASNQTAASLTKDFVLIRQDLVKFTKDLSITVQSKIQAAKNSSMALIRSPLANSRERLHVLKQALADKKETRRAAKSLKRSKKQALKTAGGLQKISDENVPDATVSAVQAPPAALIASPRKPDIEIAKHEYNKAKQHLAVLTKRGKTLLFQGDEKVSSRELRKFKKEYEKQEKALKKWRTALEAAGGQAAAP